MARNENPPFSRGETFYNGGTIDANNLGGLQMEGAIWEFEDVDYSSASVGAKKTRTNRRVKCMVARNVSGINLLPKRLVNLQTSGTDGRFYCGRVDGYASVGGQRAYPIDEFLPTAGVPNNDLFWVVVEGPAMTITDLAGGASNFISVGSFVDALTAVTSQATTAGRVHPVDFSGTAATFILEAFGRVGVALSAVTTGNTNANLLVEVGKW
jgi:hypothetical protein